MVTQEYINPNIWRIEVALPDNPLKILNAYVIASEGKYLVIDTGFNRVECREALLEGLKELNIDIKDTTLFLTHMHSDHIGLAEVFEENNCSIYMNEIDYEYFRSIKKGEIWPYLENLFLKEGFPKEEIQKQAEENQGRKYAPKRIFKVIPVKDGQKIYVGNIEMICIHTPGHTPGHTVLYIEKEKILFSGDHILFDITPNISPFKGTLNSLTLYRDSLEQIRNLPVLWTFPGHRNANGERLAERIDEIVSHHQERLEEVYRQLQFTPGMTGYEIAAKVKWSARGASFEDFSANQRWFAMGETLSHLYYMLDAHMIRFEITDGKKLYYPI